MNYHFYPRVGDLIPLSLHHADQVFYRGQWIIGKIVFGTLAWRIEVLDPLGSCTVLRRS